MIFPSNLTLVGSIMVNHIFVSTTQHWLWIANSGFWFNPHRFWLSGWSCFNQKQPTTDYELRSWQELILLIYFDGPHLFFNCFLDTWGLFLWGAHPYQLWQTQSNENIIGQIWSGIYSSYCNDIWTHTCFDIIFQTQNILFILQYQGENLLQQTSYDGYVSLQQMYKSNILISL